LKKCEPKITTTTTTTSTTQPTTTIDEDDDGSGEVIIIVDPFEEEESEEDESDEIEPEYSIFKPSTKKKVEETTRKATTAVAIIGIGEDDVTEANSNITMAGPIVGQVGVANIDQKKEEDKAVFHWPILLAAVLAAIVCFVVGLLIGSYLHKERYGSRQGSRTLLDPENKRNSVRTTMIEWKEDPLDTPDEKPNVYPVNDSSTPLVTRPPPQTLDKPSTAV